MTPGEATYLLNLRLPVDVKAWLMEEAQRRGTTMRAIILALIEKERSEKASTASTS